jgi:hypothetical protein
MLPELEFWLDARISHRRDFVGTTSVSSSRDEQPLVVLIAGIRLQTLPPPTPLPPFTVDRKVAAHGP